MGAGGFTVELKKEKDVISLKESKKDKQKRNTLQNKQIWEIKNNNTKRKKAK
jgi:hypothetical protein